MDRIQKVLARAGIGSRREIERLIAAGRIQVNGEVARPGTAIGRGDRVSIDGREVHFARALERRRSRVLLYHKPVGEVTTRADPQGRPRVFDRLPSLKTSRWINVGRLDVNTAGLLLFSTDGELANRLMHPSYGIEREYAVRVRGNVTPELLQRLTAGVELDDGPARFRSVVAAGESGGINRWYHVVLTEGRQREVRRLWESQGVEVSRLIRVRFGPVSLPRNLKPGRWLELPPHTIRALYAQVALEPWLPARSGRKRRGRRH